MPTGAESSIQVFLQDKSYKITKKEVRRIVKRIFKLEKFSPINVNIIFTDNKQIRKLKKEYFGIDSVTDVISFNMDDDLLGEIYISLPQARSQANELGISIKTEVKRLIIHGLLHLFGYDHENADDNNKMFEKQERYLKMVG
ncbi:MAG: rRNA maturation RNase YbeY [candidate division Zixibacteria bacterium]|nr:rRNA maturation RNase YbeY [candidate division Zixibacteria bacterium]